MSNQLLKIAANALRLCAACILLAMIGCGKSNSLSDGKSQQLDKLNFGIIATESTVGLKDEFDPFLEDMSKSLGIPVKSYFASDYAGVIEAMRFGKVDLGWFGNKSAIEAADRADGEVFAQTRPASGPVGYWSVIIVHRESPHQTVDALLRDAESLAFGNGDPHSTSGFLIPSYYLWRKQGIDPQATFRVVINSNHETNALSVANKHVDFATCSTEVLSQIESQKPDVFDKLRIIWKSPLIPSDPFVWRKKLPENLKVRIREFILGYGQAGPEQQRQLEVLRGISGGWGPFKASSNDQLLPLREMIIANKIETLVRSQPERNSQQQEELEQLQAKLAEIQARQKELEESANQKPGNQEPTG